MVGEICQNQGCCHYRGNNCCLIWSRPLLKGCWYLYVQSLSHVEPHFHNRHRADCFRWDLGVQEGKHFPSCRAALSQQAHSGLLPTSSSSLCTGTKLFGTSNLGHGHRWETSRDRALLVLCVTVVTVRLGSRAGACTRHPIPHMRPPKMM